MSNEDFRAIFPFTTISSHSRNKRSEHAIRALKLGVARKNGHSRGRFYGKGKYRTPKVKVAGDFIEKEYDYQTIIDDDRYDIEEYNNTLHPNQEKYAGMTRKEVFLKNINRNLPKIEPYYLYKFIGNETTTTNSKTTFNTA